VSFGRKVRKELNAGSHKSQIPQRGFDHAFLRVLPMFFDSTHISDRYTQKQGFICYEKLLFFDFQIENMT